MISPSRLLSEIAEFSLHGWDVNLLRDFPDDLPPLYADRGQLSQVISNLIINACQAMDGRGEIRLSASVRDIRDEPFLRISFKDSGPGIPPEKQEEIFKPYYTTKEEGNGLGLASCRSILSRHNGSIELDSRPGRGAEFIIHLPLNKNRHTPELPPLPAKKERGKADGCKVLIMEPNEDIRLIMTLFLREMGYEVLRADTLKEMVNLCTEAPLIIADVSSEEESCQNSLPREIRKRNTSALIIGATSNPDRSTVLTGGQCAYSSCLIKPFSYAEFSETIGEVLQKG
ncbi:MAG: hypothetical protein JXA95_07315 [Spirochaetales bacterium]|nr:hypothetical protein [Spirochaetales bacterium]